MLFLLQVFRQQQRPHTTTIAAALATTPIATTTCFFSVPFVVGTAADVVDVDI
eukprot:m.298786 g.298786  ORF g.298786 m.298786 type:complete len:53 (-) comp321664_c0_seq1:32-190(-)